MHSECFYYKQHDLRDVCVRVGDEILQMLQKHFVSKRKQLLIKKKKKMQLLTLFIRFDYGSACVSAASESFW